MRRLPIRNDLDESGSIVDVATLQIYNGFEIVRSGIKIRIDIKNK